MQSTSRFHAKAAPIWIIFIEISSMLNDTARQGVAARGIRRKLEDDPARPKLIRNEPGVGYRLLAEG